MRLGGARSALLLVLAVFASLGPNVDALAHEGTVLGVAYFDDNRDGVKQAGEAGISGERIYLFDAGGNYVTNTLTDAAGRYQFAGLAGAEYRVEYGRPDWWELWQDWAPSTTGTIRPQVQVQLTGSATVDFGWRRIVRSTDINSPLSTFTAPHAPRIESYNDVVTAQDVYDALTEGSLLGGEAPRTTIRFDLHPYDSCTSSVVEVGGRYSDFSATCSLTYIRWLDSGDQILFHEYGHAWSLYHAYIVQQDPMMISYLRARDIDPADDRLGTSHAWSRYELIAEDYRQLFGSANAKLRPQENTDLAPAAAVTGLEEFLSTTFIQTPPTTPAPAPAPAALVIADLSMTPEPVKDAGTASFSLTVPAAVTATVVNARGATVRTLAKDAPVEGSTSLPWDRRDTGGRRVKAGTYRVIVEAVSDGQRASAGDTFTVSR